MLWLLAMVFAKFLSFLSGNNNTPKRITDEENGRRREPNNQAQGGGGRGQNGGQQPHAGSVGARVQAPAAPGQAPAGNANTQLQLMNRPTTQEVGGQRNGQNEEQQVVRGGSAAPKPKAKEEQKLSKSRAQEDERARKAEEQQKRKAEKEAKLEAELQAKRDKAAKEKREQEDRERRRLEDEARRRQEAKEKRENEEREKRERKDRELRAKEDKERAKREEKDRREAEERARRERAETEKREKKEQELRDKQELKRRKQDEADRRVREEKERREREEAEKREKKQKAADARKKSPSFGFSLLGGHTDKPNPDHGPDRIDAATSGAGEAQDPSRPAGSPEAILFYEKDEPYYEFTNFAPYSVEYKGKIYPTSEHLFQAYKFMETQPDIAERIRLAPNPRTAFQEAGKLRGMQRSDWYKINITVMEMIVELKFTQHSVLYDMLLSTGNKDIVEASPIDAFWGYGPDGKGRNELGKILVRVRDRLREDMLKTGTGSRPQSMQRLEGGSQSVQNGEGLLDYPSVPPKSGSEKALAPTSKASRASIASTKDIIHRTSTPAPRPDSPIEFYDRGKPYYEFTNFSDHPILFEGKVYPTSEHLFQAHKFLGHAPNHAEHIRIQPTSRLALQEATNLRQHQRPDWFKVNISCMDFVLEQKFTQHPELRDLLLSTGDKVLVEASPIDAFWGYGQDGRGRNELGKALMRLRTKFREADARAAAAEATATTSNGGAPAHNNNGHAKSTEEARTKTPSPVHRRPLPVPPSSPSPTSASAPPPSTEKVSDPKPAPPTSPKPPPKSANRASATPIADKFATSPTLGAASPARSVASPSTKHAPLPATPDKAPPAGKSATPAPAQASAGAQSEAPPSPDPTARVETQAVAKYPVPEAVDVECPGLA